MKLVELLLKLIDYFPNHFRNRKDRAIICLVITVVDIILTICCIMIAPALGTYGNWLIVTVGIFISFLIYQIIKPTLDSNHKEKEHYGNLSYKQKEFIEFRLSKPNVYCTFDEHECNDLIYRKICYRDQKYLRSGMSTMIRLTPEAEEYYRNNLKILKRKKIR